VRGAESAAVDSPVASPSMPKLPCSVCLKEYEYRAVCMNDHEYRAALYRRIERDESFKVSGGGGLHMSTLMNAFADTEAE
jgi:hypothetical protein